MAQEAQLPLLKNLDFLKTHIVIKAIGDMGDQDEEDNYNTMINDEDPEYTHN